MLSFRYPALKTILLLLLWGGLSSATLAATFTVTNAADVNDMLCDLDCSLREAIIASNLSPGADIITFNLPGVGPHQVSVDTELPTLDDPVLIDGLSQQPGSSCDQWPFYPQIEIYDTSNSDFGFQLGSGASGSTIRGLSITGFAFRGIILGFQTSDVAIHCNFIGVRPDGVTARGNNIGIRMLGDNHRIGGNLPNALGNLISGNTNGIEVTQSTGSQILGNYLGTDVTGLAPLPNEFGIKIDPFGEVQIGSSNPGEGNVISGNFFSGILAHNECQDTNFIENNRIQGNFIGVGVDGITPVGNNIHGIDLFQCAGLFTINNTLIGGSGPGEGNVISANGENGIFINGSTITGTVIAGNRIGTDLFATLNLGNGHNGIRVNSGVEVMIGGLDLGAGNVIAHNALQGVIVEISDVQENEKTSILGNSIYDNGELGIDLLAPGDDAGVVTQNDPGDVDTGPNYLQNFPVLNQAQVIGPELHLNGSLESLPNESYRIEYFSNSTCDPSGHGEGRRFLDAHTVTTDGAGSATLQHQLLVDLVPGELVTATATATNSANATSEFSDCQIVTVGSIIEVPTLGTWGFLALLFSLGIIGMVSLRR